MQVHKEIYFALLQYRQDDEEGHLEINAIVFQKRKKEINKLIMRVAELLVLTGFVVYLNL